MAKEQDQSMEEILQSIKRIIAEEGEPAPSGSDVLELTELLEDDGKSTPGAPPAAASVGSLSIEEIMAAPVAPEFQPTPPAAKRAAAAPASLAAAAKDEEALLSDKTLSSSSAALDALRNIPHPPLPPMPASGMHFRSGQTIEDLVLEALRPMLKEWLDENLTKMVERLVEKEVRRLSAR